MDGNTILIKGEEIRINDIPNPVIREILINAKSKNICIPGGREKASISFSWHDWSKHGN